MSAKIQEQRQSKQNSAASRSCHALEAACPSGVPEDTSLPGIPEGTSLPGVPVAYSLQGIAASIAGRVFIVGLGNTLKHVVKQAVKAGISPLWVAGTEDKRKAFAFSGTAQVVCLGTKFDERLFSNEYAIIEAARQIHASALLVCDTNLGATKLLRKELRRANIQLFIPLGHEKVPETWLSYETHEDFDSAPEPQWRACPKCKLFHDMNQVLANHGTCPTCKQYYRLNSLERIAETFDKDSFVEWFSAMPASNPIGFPDYEKLLENVESRSGLDEAVRCGCAKLAGQSVATCIMESTFMMGSMGTVVGEKITRTIERATEEELPLIIFTASGGARMQEGLCSLMQMAKTSAALERHSQAGLLYISVICDPTTGGVTASFASLGDIILAEPGALAGFAGRRVIQDTIHQSLPEGFQTAEFALEHGLIDAVVPRRELRHQLASLVALHQKNDADAAEGKAAVLQNSSRFFNLADFFKGEHPEDFAKASPGNATKNQSLVNIAVKAVWNHRKARLAYSKRSVADAPGIKMFRTQSTGGKNPAWDSVMTARNTHRPTAQYYIRKMIVGFIQLHGDRAGFDDKAIIGGIGWLGNQAVTIIAEEKGANLNERIACNFGCPQPQGYRKAIRLMKQAEKFGRPVICLVDTQGAFCGAESEEHGQGNAIAESIQTMAGLRVPVVCVILGEGGSGGALALAVGNRVAMQEHAVYSILSPEGFASILWKDRTRAAEAAAVMKVAAHDVLKLGIIEEILPEGNGPAHENPKQAADAVSEFVLRSLAELDSLDGERLRQQRYSRFRAF